MLASITPLGERGRHSHWVLTVSAFFAAGAGAGVLLGAALGLAGSLAISAVSEAVRLLALAAGLGIAIALESAPTRVPGPRRQVNERWLDRYRGWVYGGGYGAQLGAGVFTVVTSAATYVALLAAFLTASVGQGALIFGGYGAIRGLTPLLAAGVRTPGQLLALHARLGRAEGGAARAGPALMAAALILALARSLT